MTVSITSGYALSGIQSGMQGLRSNAAEIASADNLSGQGTRGVAQPLVEQRLNANQVEASAKVLQTENQMLGTLIDMKV
ncbi:hypothetical protein M911_13615 [Ectothiorhodospira haloalkaliphila]|uniref:Flagellar basal-body/hook protein C-terminal domain-containing protein n=1 Tax=Ectothiorhodospira haloalkaliphila TaxID=421628 RepID=W8KLG9_9GAMM|nr:MULTISPECIES: hypothetical protein [Ectothiorhodospira]AHK80018.1 hypothetical protein M911_13615 [Ectothiorhodospira haloalkaliphila]MCG5494470.1 hypothetical protein [Ectothiorhodospira variabilis]MCG5498883.1 hypothetical protein [Ectothiorhodospira variabilis]MCG5503159.1 hypothetical protein [Ectothiorhodospira variabilis]MCG5506082.1 hypothetical protein [Ectothiorhodospira variabilis]